MKDASNKMHIIYILLLGVKTAAVNESALAHIVYSQEVRIIRIVPPRASPIMTSKCVGGEENITMLPTATKHCSLVNKAMISPRDRGESAEHSMV
eukprot:scaffold79760_cov57-Attheya_sp.AAC.10